MGFIDRPFTIVLSLIISFVRQPCVSKINTCMLLLAISWERMSCLAMLWKRKAGVKKYRERNNSFSYQMGLVRFPSECAREGVAISQGIQSRGPTSNFRPLLTRSSAIKAEPTPSSRTPESRWPPPFCLLFPWICLVARSSEFHRWNASALALLLGPSYLAWIIA